MKTVDQVQPHRYSRHVYFDTGEQEYVALCTEFPHLSAFGDTPSEALAELDVVLDGALAVHREEGWPIPEPLAPPEPRALPSGKFVLRLPRSLHARLVRRADHEGVSLNALAIALLAEGVATMRTTGELAATATKDRATRSRHVARHVAETGSATVDPTD